jgi:hypothetical protein
MKTTGMRSAFSMITAIFIIILMATVSVLILGTAGKMVKETTAEYQREQAILLARSYTEYAIMAVTANDHTGSHCLKGIQGSFQNYEIDVKLLYIGRGLDPSCGIDRILANDVSTPRSPLNVIIDVFVRYPDYDHPADHKITYHRRTLQKI